MSFPDVLPESPSRTLGMTQKCKLGPSKSEGENPKVKSSAEQVFLNNFRWVPASCHREEGKSSRELFKKVRADEVFWVFRDFRWVWGPLPKRDGRPPICSFL